MDYNVIMAIVMTATVSAIALVLQYRYYHRTVKKVTFLFNAIDNHDFSFRFSTHGKNKVVNEALNRIKKILEQARQDALEREQYYESIINAVPTGIMVVDEKGTVLQHNEAALRLLDLEQLNYIMPIEEKLQTNDFHKREIPAELNNKRVKIITFSDIRSELTNKELESWTKLIRVLTHEIMNNVAPITSLSETLISKTKEDDVRQGLHVIKATGQQLLHFVENYRRLTLVPKPSPKLFYARPFLERITALEKMRQLPTGNNNDCNPDITILLSPPDMLLYADESLVGHVVTNILKNAVEAGANHIDIHAYTDKDDNICMDISNNGNPIPHDSVGSIFVPFFTTKSKGSGIGLNVSMNIMKQSGGNIELVQSDITATTFRLTF